MGGRQWAKLRGQGSPRMPYLSAHRHTVRFERPRRWPSRGRRRGSDSTYPVQRRRVSCIASRARAHTSEDEVQALTEVVSHEGSVSQSPTSKWHRFKCRHVVWQHSCVRVAERRHGMRRVSEASGETMDGAAHGRCTTSTLASARWRWRHRAPRVRALCEERCQATSRPSSQEGMQAEIRMLTTRYAASQTHRAFTDQT